MELDELGFGELNERKKKVALSPSKIIPLDVEDINYKNPPSNSSPETASELRYIAHIVENTEFSQERLKELDKDFFKTFIRYASENGLQFDKQVLKEIVEDSAHLILRLKKHYDRPRPFQLAPHHAIDLDYNKNIQGEMGTAHTPSYPSGHTTQAYILAGILAKDNPDHIDPLMKIASDVELSRIKSGVHFPTDNEFGKILARNYILPALEKKVYLNTNNKTFTKMSASKPYKYTTTFKQEIIAASEIESGEWKISEASLEKLRPLIPKNIDFEKNIDLLGVAFNAAVVNRFNKNDDGIDTNTALAIKDYFVNKPTNIEHQKQKVVGHIVSSAFSKYGTNEIIDDNSAKSLNGPFNIACAAVVYRTVNRQFADLVQDNFGGFDKKISASWEIGFNDYHIALGSKDLDEAELITDPAKIQEFSNYLKANEGPGELEDGTKVYRLVVGNIYPLGIGFTTNPAADVEGLIVQKKDEDPEQEDTSVALYSCPECIEVENKFIKNLKTDENKISHSRENVVNYNHTKPLKIMETDILEKLERVITQHDYAKEFSKEAVANIGEVVQEAIRQKSEEYVAEKEKAANAERALADAEENFKKSVAEIESKLSAAEEKISTLEAETLEREAKEAFNARMGLVDEMYQLDDEDRKILARELGGLDVTDEAFAEYQERIAVVWKHKDKEVIKKQEEAMEAAIQEEVQKRISQIEESAASVAGESDVTVETAMDNIEEEDSPVPSNSEASTEEPQTLEDKYREAFSKDNLIIS